MLGDGRSFYTSGVSEISMNFGSFSARPFLFRIAQTLIGDVILGQDFLREMGCIIDLTSNLLSFSDSTVPPLPFVVNREESESIADFSLDDFTIGTHLTNDQKDRLHSLLNKYKGIFSNKLGRTSLVMQEIRVTSDQPVNCAIRKTSPSVRAEVSRQIDEMLQANIISPSISPFSAPAHLVLKKDGSYRFVVDYRQLNKITISDPYPLPTIDDTLAQIKGSKFISILDLKSGFWQQEIHPDSREKTAFVCSRGKFEYNTCPMGLKNSPRAFSRLMDIIFKDRENRGVCNYLDDLIVGTDSFDEHLDSLEYVFSKLLEHNLTLKRKKISLAVREARVLGFTLNEKGIQIDEEKLEAIKNYPRPRNLKDTLSFLGLASWHSKFIFNFSVLAKPLHELKKKQVKFFWGPRQEDSFLAIKKALLESTALNLYSQDYPCILTTDASQYGLGVVFSQFANGQERPVAYASRLLDPAEMNYSTIEREMLAIYYGIKRFSHYLQGVPFEIRTDHRPLTWLNSHLSPNARLTRWALFLQSFEFKIIYKEGKSNLAADSLSRYPCLRTDFVDKDITARPNIKPTVNFDIVPTSLSSNINDSSCEGASSPSGVLNILEIPGAPFEQFSLDQIKNLQVTDPECILIKANLVNSTSRDFKNYYMNSNGVLYRKPNLRFGEKIFLPGSLRPNILKLYHDHPASGHRGRDKTLQQICSKFYWPTCRADVFRYVKTCSVCQKYKCRNTKTAGLLKSIPIDMKPGEMVSIDLMGPFPMSSARNRFLCAIVDYATRSCELFPLKSSLAKNITKCLVQYVGRNGTPKHILSDRGPQFISQIYKQFCTACYIKPKYTSPYHPQTDLTERINRTIKQHIAMYVGNAHREWDGFLDFIQLAINSQINETLGYSPFFLLRGVDPSLPWERLDLEVADLPVATREIPLYIQEVIKARDFVKEHSAKAQQKQAQYYNKRHTDFTFQKGDLVIRETHKLSNASVGVTKKLFPRFEGPFVITDCINNLNFALMHPTTKRREGIWHISHLKPFHERKEETAGLANETLPEDNPGTAANIGVNSPDVAQTSGSRSEQNPGQADEDEPVAVSTATVPPLHLPFKLGWFREVVVRKQTNRNSKNLSDVYYYSPTPSLKKFRSIHEIERGLVSDILSVRNFCFKPVAIFHEPHELIRSAWEPSVKQLHSGN